MMSGPAYSDVTEDMYERLPEVYRESDAIQTEPGELLALPERINECPNPQPVSTTGWSGLGGSVVTAPWDAGRKAYRSVGTGSGTPYIFSATSPNAFVAGEQVTVSADIIVPAGFKFYVRVHARAGNVYFGGQTFVTSSKSTVQRVSHTFTLTSGVAANNLDMALVWADTNAQPVGTNGIEAYMGNVLIERSGVVRNYFDGGTPQPSDPRLPSGLYSWNGTANASTSKAKSYEGDPAGYPLKRYLSSVGDTLGEVRALYERFDYEAAVGDMSDLVYTPEADDAWLDYIAQVLGVGQLRGLTPAQKRTVLVDPSIGYRAGTPESIVSAASTAVGGSGYVGLYKFTTDVSAIGAATMWDILLVTRSGEVTGDVVQAVKNLGVKPSGVKLYWREWEVTWTDIHTNYPTWASINALPNWAALEKTGI